MEDKIIAKSIQYFEHLDEIIEKARIPEQAIDIFKDMFMSAVMDLTIHFQLVPDTNIVGFELWKRTMGLDEYCRGVLTELSSRDNWDVNWFEDQYGYDLTPIYEELYNTFRSLC